MFWKQLDYYGQSTLAILAIGLFVIAFPFGALLLIPFGAWQVISALVVLANINQYESDYQRKHVIYLGAVALYFLSWLFVPGEDGWMTLYIIPPLVLGMYYWFLTRVRLMDPRVLAPRTGFLPNVEL